MHSSEHSETVAVLIHTSASRVTKLFARPDFFYPNGITSLSPELRR